MKHLSKFVSGFVIGVIGVALCADALHTPLRAGEPPPSISVDNTPINRSTSGLTSFAPVVKKAAPSVVNIYSTHVVHYREFSPFMNNPLFQQFHQFFGTPDGNGQQLTRHEEVLGSGVIITADGYILTANHVVADSDQIKIAVPGNKKEYTAKIIGTDPETDVAVLKINGENLPAITLGNSDQIEVGDIVLAIGNPFDISQPGQTPTVTMGIVSALGRSGLGFNGYENFIQTDAAINPGNSGGALIDARGDLIGINTAILSGGGGNEGVGFAIPINLAHNIMDQLVEHGKVVRGYLGVSIQAVSPDMAKAFGLNQGGGALIGDVVPNGPAAKAGIERGDIVLQLNGTPVTSPDDLSLRTSELAPGSVAHLKIYRNGKTQDVNVTLGEFPENGQAGGQPTPGAGAALKGVQVQNLDASLRQQLGIPAGTSGVAVTNVDPGSAAAAVGIQQGDVIQEVNHKPVHNVSEFEQAVAGLANQPVLLLINRNGTTQFVVVEPQG